MLQISANILIFDMSDLIVVFVFLFHHYIFIACLFLSNAPQHHNTYADAMDTDKTQLEREQGRLHHHIQKTLFRFI